MPASPIATSSAGRVHSSIARMPERSGDRSGSLLVRERLARIETARLRKGEMDKLSESANPVKRAAAMPDWVIECPF
jgi:hypothetical protein